METLKELNVEAARLQAIISRTEQRIKEAPVGSLEMFGKSENPSYRIKTWNKDNKKRQRRYLRTDEMELIQKLAQKGYDAKLLKEAEKQYATLTSFLSQYDPKALAKVFESLSPERKALIKAEELDDEEFVKQWEAVTYPPAEFEESDPEFYTIREERVRSKTEKIIADTMLVKKIPYRFEPPLIIVKGKKPWRPDFLVLNKRTRREYIWEHLGKMDDEDYCRRNIRKLEKYQQQGLFIGDRLLITMETSTNQLPTKIIDLMIEKYLI